MIGPFKFYPRVVGARGMALAAAGRFRRSLNVTCVQHPDLRHPVHLRVPSSDVWAFDQVFFKREYAFDVRSHPQVIVDAGANIGLASICFANRFPQARIIAIEPEQSNLDILGRNVAPYPNITVVAGALWHDNTHIDLLDPGLGKWGFMTGVAGDGTSDSPALHKVRAMTVDAVMREQGLDHIDILKIDIEGAEREVFSNSSAWIGRVDALIVELHERMKPGCHRSFYNGSNGFDHEWVMGENVYLTRERGCLAA